MLFSFYLHFGMASFVMLAVIRLRSRMGGPFEILIFLLSFLLALLIKMPVVFALSGN